ncbi:MAG TPA: NTP transferase domain-containing protein [Firmicutes bacterium]|nr:NTP transferase domain-containing protein [Bacillota bacterium]
MIQKNNCAVILAAGEGKRMQSKLPKVLCPVLFKPMVDWVIDAAAQAVEEICLVVGHGGDQVRAHTAGRCRCVEQKERLGTGHAVMQAADFLRAHAGGHTLVLCGDAPLMDGETLAAALAFHKQADNAVTVISARLEDPASYGRIIRDEAGRLAAIVEYKDADANQRAVKEINSGAYWFRTNDLLEVLPRLQNNNAQGEYYLTDAVSLLLQRGAAAGAFAAENPDVVLGANNRADLLQLNEKARMQVINRLLAAGVDIPCADGLLIGPDVTVGRDTCILPATVLCGRTSVGEGCRLGPALRLEDCRVSDGTVLSCCDRTGEVIQREGKPL